MWVAPLSGLCWAPRRAGLPAMSAPPPLGLTPQSPAGRRPQTGPRSPLNHRRRSQALLDEEAERVRQERLSWARFDGATAAPSPSLFPGSTGPRDPYGLGPDATPPRLGSSRRTRRSLEQDIELAGSSVRFSPPAPSAYAAAVAQPPEAALSGADEFDRALFGLATELDPWQSGAQAHLALVDYSEFRFVAESFRRWILCARRPTAPRPTTGSLRTAPSSVALCHLCER